MLDSVESAGPAFSGAMAPKKKQLKPDRAQAIAAQAARLKLLRRVHGYETATAFAVFLELGITHYHPFEKSTPLTQQAAFRLVEKIPGLTLDWLFYGKPDGLPLELARRLEVFGNRKTD